MQELSRGTVGAHELVLRRKNLVIFEVVDNGQVTEIRGKRNATAAFEELKKLAYKEAATLHAPQDPRIRADVARVIGQAITHHTAEWLNEHGLTMELVAGMSDRDRLNLSAKIKGEIMPDVVYGGVMYRASRSTKKALDIDYAAQAQRPNTWLMPKKWANFAEQVAAYGKAVLYNAIVGGDTVNERWRS